ncbi:MAG: 3-hydroxyacyl-CoA dehydrogenase family protein [Bacteroidales bacterium]|nr:3-hydroxyacyl-CoA dehydrogenase family protein [Bacteroidales bacterium]
MIQRIGIIGAGKMGTSLFFYLNGYREFKLCWLCSDETAKEKALASFLKKMKFLLKSGVMTEEEHAAKLSGAIITTQVSDLADCELIIEAITEDAEKKRMLFHHLDININPACIFTTNASSILPSQLLPSEERKDKMAGMHFFFPITLKKTVELITTDHTSEKTKQTLQHFLQSIGKDIFPQDESNTFILNRLFLDFQAGAYEIVREGKISYKKMDTLVKEKFFPAGVFEFFDHVGIDVMLASIKAYTKNSQNKPFYEPLIMKMEGMVEENKLGVKTKQGFYDYPPQARQKGVMDDPGDENKDYLQSAEERLQGIFMQSVKSVLDQGLVSPQKLAEMVADYTGIWHYLCDLIVKINNRYE